MVAAGTASRSASSALKENLLWVRSFETIEELRLALLEFKRTYNEQWMLEKYDFAANVARNRVRGPDVDPVLGRKA